MMNSGVKTLNKQLEDLEKKAADFEIPLPQLPPATQNTSVDPEAGMDTPAAHILSDLMITTVRVSTKIT